MPETARARVRPGNDRFEARLAALDAWDAPWQRMDARYPTSMLLARGLGWLIILLPAAAPSVLGLLGLLPGAWTAVGLVVLGLLLIWAAADLLLIPRRARAVGYAEREEDVLVRRGVLSHRVTAVPYGRMQYVEVSQGPWQRLFGLSSVTFRTASAAADVSVPGVSREEARRLREELSRRGRERMEAL